MHKLLHSRTATKPPHPGCAAAAAAAAASSLPLSSIIGLFSTSSLAPPPPPLGFKLKTPTSPMPPTAASVVSGGSSFILSPVFPRNPTNRVSCRLPTRCALGGGGRPGSVPLRAWAVCKDTKLGGHAAWLCTLSDAVKDLDDDGVADKSSDSEEEKSEGGKPVKVTRRQRGSTNSNPAGSGAAAGALARNPDLLTIPGVGPRNFRKLVENGYEGVAQLKKLYKDKFYGKSSEKMVEYLQSSVGIIHKNHAESITTYIKDTVDKELNEDDTKSNPPPARKDRLTFCVEGNISVGKSTFLQRIANETIELQDLVEVVPEPVNKWQNVGPDNFNILDAFYSEPQRYAYTFQNYVFVTRVMQERESSSGIRPLRLMERSVFSDRMVFVRAVHEAKWMNEMEISIYDSWFDPVVSCLPGLIPDAFIYLRATPDTCHKRMMLRKRNEEGGVSLDYLRDLHEKHESWLFPSRSEDPGLLSINKPLLLMDSSLHPDIRDRVFYLEGNHMHSSIQKVPALVLDCEPNIDFNKDIDAKKQYAHQVAEFFEFVKKKKEKEAENSSEDAAEKTHPGLMLPNPSSLWVPGQHNFPESLDFQKAMSLMPGR